MEQPVIGAYSCSPIEMQILNSTEAALVDYKPGLKVDVLVIGSGARVPDGGGWPIFSRDALASGAQKVVYFLSCWKDHQPTFEDIKEHRITGVREMKKI